MPCFGGYGFFGNFGSFSGLGWAGMIVNLVLTIGLIAGLVVLVVWAVRRFSGTSAQPYPVALTGQTAKEIAQARYARGEITREEYQQLLSDLSR